MLRSVDSLCFLGVAISADLKWWSVHASNVRSSVNKTIGVLNRFGGTLNVNAKRRKLQALITQKLAYCVPVWGHLSKNQIEAMNHVIQHAACVVLHNKSACLDQSVHDLTGLMPFNIMAMQRCAITVSPAIARGCIVLSATFACGSEQSEFRASDSQYSSKVIQISRIQVGINKEIF